MARRAVCVGINNFADRDIPALRGCVNDARNVAQTLLREFGFESQDVRVLVNQQATKAAYLAALDWLVGSASAGDQLVLFTSSHGSHVPDDNNDDADGEDEVLVAYDHDWERTILRDDELSAHLARLPRGVSMVCLWDTCHSGTMEDTTCPTYATRGLRAPVAGRSLSPGVEFLGGRFLEPPRRRGRKRALDAPTRAARPRARAQGCTPADHENLPALSVSACADDETAADASFGGVNEGAFTHCLLEMLHQADGDLTWEVLHQRTLRRVKALGFDQTPQVHVPTGLKDQPVFGGRRARGVQVPGAGANLTALDGRIVALENAGNWAAAAQSLQQRVSLVGDPAEKVRTLEHLVSLYRVKLGDEAGAQRVAEQLLSVAPAHEGALGYLRQAYTARGDMARLQALEAHAAQPRAASKGLLDQVGGGLQSALGAVGTAAAGVFTAVTSAPVAYEQPGTTPSPSPSPAARPAATSRKCPYCRADNAPSASACQACGAGF